MSTVEVPDFASMRDDTDPFAVIFVVNDSRDEEGNIIAPEKNILQASSNALIKLLDSDDEEVTARLKSWTSGRIRKIVKRAKASAWNKVVELPHFAGNYEGTQVIAFAPMRISEQPKELKKLQVTGLNSELTAPMPADGTAHLLVKVNASLGMSTGKLVAQVGHAVQLFLAYGEKDQILDWNSTGSRLRVIKAENLSETAISGIVVHDAGFTEVPSGSLTATAEYVFKTEGK